MLSQAYLCLTLYFVRHMKQKPSTSYCLDIVKGPTSPNCCLPLFIYWTGESCQCCKFPFMHISTSGFAVLIKTESNQMELSACIHQVQSGSALFPFSFQAKSCFEQVSATWLWEPLCLHVPFQLPLHFLSDSVLHSQTTLFPPVHYCWISAHCQRWGL